MAKRVPRWVKVCECVVRCVWECLCRLFLSVFVWRSFGNVGGYLAGWSWLYLWMLKCFGVLKGKFKGSFRVDWTSVVWSPIWTQLWHVRFFFHLTHWSYQNTKPPYMGTYLIFVSSTRSGARVKFLAECKNIGTRNEKITVLCSVYIIAVNVLFYTKCAILHRYQCFILH